MVAGGDGVRLRRPNLVRLQIFRLVLLFRPSPFGYASDAILFVCKKPTRLFTNYMLQVLTRAFLNILLHFATKV